MKIKRQFDENSLWVQVVIDSILVLLGIITLYPMLNVLAISFSDSHEIASSPLMIFPKGFTIEAYRYIFSTSVLLKSFLITVGITCIGTFLNLLFTITAAYGLAKTDVPGYKFFVWIILTPMLISAGLIPNYIWFKTIGLIDSLWVLILPLLVTPYNFMLMRNYFWSIPPSLEESALIDGANEFRILFKIIIPLSMPVIATIGLFYAVGHWNNFFQALYFINDNTKWPLQVVLRSIIVDLNMLNMGGSANDSSQMVLTEENIKAATIIFAVVPIILVYPYLQKYFVKGIMLGSVKG